jgi:hypothetical protein
MNNMTNNDHRRTAYTMTKKQNEQHDKQRSQKDNLHNDQKQNEQHDKQRSTNKGNNKITELRTILQRESQNS